MVNKDMMSKTLTLSPEAGTSVVQISDSSDFLSQASFDVSSPFLIYKQQIAQNILENKQKMSYFVQFL